MGASPGCLAALAHNIHLRQILASLNMFTLNRSVLISNIPNRFDKDGNLTVVKRQERIREYLVALVQLTIALG